MVDPRIYRAGLAFVALAVIVFAFSLSNQPGPARTTLPPGAGAGGASSFTTMQRLAASYAARAPGSPGDAALAGYVAGQLRSDGSFAVSQRGDGAATAVGSRTITTVTATRIGLQPGTIVVIAERDLPGPAGLSGTAALLWLGHALAGETLNHSVMLISTTGSAGSAGANVLAHELAGQGVDAVVALGDLAAAQPSRPIVLGWSDSPVLAPSQLTSTLSQDAGALSGISPGGPSLEALFAHLAFPLATGAEGPFGRYGIPAVELSLSGNRAPDPREPVSAAHLAALQAAVLQTVDALDAGPPVPAPHAYLLLSRQLVPAWAVRLLVLALIAPVGIATVDALARVRRRGHSILRWLVWVLAGALPYLLVLAALLVVRLTGALPAPPAPAPSGSVPLGAAGIAVLVVCALLLAGAFWLLRPLCLRLAARIGAGSRPPTSPAGDAAGVALMLVMCAVSLVCWLFDPFTAALLVLALHLWLWLPAPGLRARRSLTLLLAALGVSPIALLVLYYAHSLGLSPLGVVWMGALLVAGGQVTSLAGIFWALVAGCFTAVLVLGLRAPAAEPAAAEVTVRGPIGYAGPGSLGGTESALGSRR